MDQTPAITPYALTTLDHAFGYVKGAANRSDVSREWLSLFISAATGKMERHCRRRLAARTHRNPVTINCDTTVDDETLTGAGFLTLVKTLDDAVGVALAPGSRVESITNDGALELTNKAINGSPAAVTFGSAPLWQNGDGESLVMIPEFPVYSVADVYSIATIADDGSATEYDLAGLKLESSTGMVWLASGQTTGFGKRNIRIECKAGFDLDRDWGDAATLESICLRYVQTLWKDFQNQVGRAADSNFLGANERIANLDIPADIKADLASFVRRF